MIIKGVSGENGRLLRPIVYFNGKIWVLRRYSAEIANCRFGGALPNLNGLSDKAKLHALFTINATGLQDGIGDEIPLLFPFKHEAGSAAYSCQNADAVNIIEILPETASKNFPYDDYPDEFDIKHYILDGPVEIPLTAVESLIPQGINPNFTDRMIVLVPPHDEYEVSLWGNKGDSENILCVFYVDVVKKEIFCENRRG